MVSTAKRSHWSALAAKAANDQARQHTAAELKKQNLALNAEASCAAVLATKAKADSERVVYLERKLQEGAELLRLTQQRNRRMQGHIEEICATSDSQRQATKWHKSRAALWRTVAYTAITLSIVLLAVVVL